MSGRIRNQFLAGLLVLLPSAAALFIIYRGGAFLDRILDPILIPIFARLGVPRIPLVGLILLLVIVWFVGIFASNLIGRRMPYLDRK